MAKMASKAMKLAKAEAKKHDPKIRVELAGSYPKDTWLAGLHEIDMFFLFPVSYEDDLEEEALPLLHAIAEKLGGVAEEKYAQHPYLHVKAGEFFFDLVPAFDLKGRGKMTSAVDRTPLHTRYVKKRLKRHADVRLLKRFCKGIGIYGADMKVQGFSGYLCELLVLKFGNFLKVLRQAAAWKLPLRIEIEKAKKKTRFDSPFVFPDPVDEERNVASAVSSENLAAFIAAAKAYLKKPSESFFFPQEPQLPEKLKVDNFFVLEFGLKQASEDIVYSQLRRVADQLRVFLARHGFQVNSSAVFSEERGLLLVEVSKTMLSPLAVVRGPPASLAAASLRFREQHEGQDVFAEAGRLWARVPRKFIHINDALAAAPLALPSYLISPPKIFSASSYYANASRPAKFFLLKQVTKAKPWEAG